MASPVMAVNVDNLYLADVFVTSQNEEQLRAGARAGLLQVLIRVSGDDQLAQNIVIRGALASPKNYYYQYSYQATDREFQIGDEIVAAKILRLHFQPNAIAKLLRDAKLPIWGNNRPGVLVWLVLDDGSGRRFESDVDTSELIESVNIHALQRGIPLFYPLLDLEDSALLSVDEVWGSYKDRIDAASERYKPDSVLTARLQKLDAERWAANWSYRVENRWYNGNHTAFSTDDIAAVMIADLAGALAKQYAFDSTHNEIELIVEDISSISDYAEVTRYLDGLAPVIEAQVVEIRGTQMQFRLVMQGSSDQLTGLIRLDDKMIPSASINRLNTLNYQWTN